MSSAEPEIAPRRTGRALMLAALLLGAPMLVPPGARAQEAWHFLAPHGYVVTGHFPLEQKVHGIDGALELQLDDRIPGRVRRDYAQMYWFGTTGNPAIEQSVMGQWLIPAQLRLVDRQGDTLAEFPLTSPFADVQPVALSSAWPEEFLVLVQQGGFGAFNGTQGLALAVADGRIQPLRATDTLTEEVRPIELQRTIRTDWQILPGPSGAEILQLSCTPEDISEDGFREIFALYKHGRDGWTYETRLDRGYCAWHGEFPPRELFP
ncbi:hypothetical protein [Azospirillum sp. sgz301742]